MKEFGDIAISLAKNPLGIISLFIVLVYALATLIMLTGKSLKTCERLPLIYFLIAYPFFVLFTFTWTLVYHHQNLYAPSDYKNEDTYLKQMTIVSLLTAANAKNKGTVSEATLQRIVEVARGTVPSSISSKTEWRNHILWVDDNPENNTYERQAFQAIGLHFTLALTTNEALDLLSNNQYGIIISDMGRKEGPREGYVLLDQLRKQNNNTPLFFYASSNKPEHKQETFEHGGQGATNNPQELFEMIIKTIITR